MAKQENHNDNHAATMTSKQDTNIQVFNLNPTVPKFREKTSSFSKRIGGSSALECKELQQFNEATNAAAAIAAAAGKDSPR